VRGRRSNWTEAASRALSAALIVQRIHARRRVPSLQLGSRCCPNGCAHGPKPRAARGVAIDFGDVTMATSPSLASDGYVATLPHRQQDNLPGDPRAGSRRRSTSDRNHGAHQVSILRAAGQPFAPFKAAKEPRHIFLHDGGKVPDPEGIVTAGHDNKTARTAAIRQGETINARAIMPRSGKSPPTIAAAGAS
jgi:hypothetical protein